MAESLDEQFTRVQAAIAKIEQSGEELEYDGKRTKRAELSTLYAREKDLMRRIGRASRGGGIRQRQGVMR